MTKDGAPDWQDSIGLAWAAREETDEVLWPVEYLLL